MPNNTTSNQPVVIEEQAQTRQVVGTRTIAGSFAVTSDANGRLHYTFRLLPGGEYRDMPRISRVPGQPSGPVIENKLQLAEVLTGRTLDESTKPAVLSRLINQALHIRPEYSVRVEFFPTAPNAFRFYGVRRTDGETIAQCSSVSFPVRKMDVLYYLSDIDSQCEQICRLNYRRGSGRNGRRG